jgi:hypothetical protein
MDHTWILGLLGVLTVAAILWPRSDDLGIALNMKKPQTLDAQFSYVSGLFQHDLQPVGPDTGFRAKTLPRLGIINRKYDSDIPAEHGKLSWERLEDYLKSLNAANTQLDRYKVLLVARHGEGNLWRPARR